MAAIKEFILDAIDSRLLVGDKVRLIHETKEDGTPCSKDKDAALTVTRTYNGWVYKCHRCGEYGFISGSQKTPTHIKQRIKNLKKPKHVSVTAKAELPYDFTRVDAEHCTMPEIGMRWLQQYQIDISMVQNYNIGWSDAYQRIIFPIYNVRHKDEDKNNLESWIPYPIRPHIRMCRLIGWTGRDVYWRNDKTRKKYANKSKWLSQRDSRIKRLYMHLPSKGKELILCEDVVSAIKIYQATGYATIALLTTYIEKDMMPHFRDKHIYVWLDSDMTTKSIHYVKRLQTFGIKARHVQTPEDPKALTYRAIFNKLTGIGE